MDKFIKILSPTATEPEDIIYPSDSDINHIFGNYTSFQRLVDTKNIFKLVDSEGTYIVKLYKKFNKNRIKAYQKLQEVQKLNNKNVHLLKIINFGNFSKDLSYEMCEYIENNSIVYHKEFVKQNINIFIKQIAVTINFLHLHNILHLDIKPSNCFLISKYPICFVLADYGIIVFLDEDQETVKIEDRGTIYYNAPETFFGIVDRKADYWSLGMTILTLLDENPLKGYPEDTINSYKYSNRIIPELTENPNYEILLHGLMEVIKDDRWDYAKILEWLDGKITSSVKKYKQEIKNITAQDDKSYENLQQAVSEASDEDRISICGEYKEGVSVNFDKRLFISGDPQAPSDVKYHVFDCLIIHSNVDFINLSIYGKISGKYMMRIKKNATLNIGITHISSTMLHSYGEMSGYYMFTVEENAELNIGNSHITCQMPYFLLAKKGCDIKEDNKTRINITNQSKIETNIGLFVHNSSVTVENSEIIAKNGPAIFATDSSTVILKDVKVKSLQESFPSIVLNNKSKIEIDKNTTIESKNGICLSKDETSKIAGDGAKNYNTYTHRNFI